MKIRPSTARSVLNLEQIKVQSVRINHMSLENPYPSGGQESEHPESIPGIEKAAGFVELFGVLRTLDGLSGSDGTRYSSEDLEERIRLVRAGGRLNSITRTGGLREKVATLLAREKEDDEKDFMPKVGDPIVLIKISQAESKNTEEIEGILTQEIVLGEPVFFGAGRHTSEVKSMSKGEGGIIVQTENSTYLLKKTGV